MFIKTLDQLEKEDKENDLRIELILFKGENENKKLGEEDGTTNETDDILS